MVPDDTRRKGKIQKGMGREMRKLGRRFGDEDGVTGIEARAKIADFPYGVLSWFLAFLWQK
jgi:hypothetical protein